MVMTFKQAEHLIKRADAVSFRHALDSGLDPNLANQFGHTILMIAARQGDTSIGRLLIDAGASLDKRRSGQATYSALSLAIMSGHVKFVKLLLDKGASLECHPWGNSLDVFLDWTEQYCAISKEQIGHIRTLINASRNLSS
jgi:ankyrin repeat protein